MNRTWLLLDCSYLAHRAWHALGDSMTHESQPTAAIFGFLQEVLRLQAEFDTKLIAFAFDAGHGPRTEILPEYKQGRQRQRDEETEEERESRRKFYLQLRRLREQYLSQAGFRNVFWQDGREADDVLASLAKSSLNEDDSAVIVSSDHDMWQCIDHRTSVYNPQTKVLLDRDAFMAKWGIEPALWSSVKAIAGCGADNVPGLRGIGEVTAAKYYRGKLKPESAAFRKITGEGIDVYNRNIKIVRLPFAGTEVFRMRPDEVSRESWNGLAERLGMKSLMDSVPGMPRGIRKQRDVVKRRPTEGFGF
jgi:5'-3' exonuclease